jgi:hypothetical protein
MFLSHPDQLVRGTDPRIRIRIRICTKMSRIPNTASQITRNQIIDTKTKKNSGNTINSYNLITYDFVRFMYKSHLDSQDDSVHTTSEEGKVADDRVHREAPVVQVALLRTS